MGSRRDCTWILGLVGFRVVTTDSDGEVVDGRLTIRIERRGVRRYSCSGCGRRTSRVWTYTTRDGVARFLFGWLKALCWQRLPEMEKLGDTLVNHFDGIAAYCDHSIRFGVVESLNTTIKAVLRRGAWHAR